MKMEEMIAAEDYSNVKYYIDAMWTAMKNPKRMCCLGAYPSFFSPSPPVMNIGKWIASKHKAAQMEAYKEARRILPKDGRYAREVEEAGLDVPWLTSLGGLHANLYKFGVNAVTDNNPHAGIRRRHAASNNVIISDRCSLCTTQTQILAHMLSFCPISLGNASQEHRSRYLFRHNNILRLLITELKSILPSHFTFLCDLHNHEYHYAAFPERWALTPLRPELLIHDTKDDILWIAELTAPMESNMKNKHEAKKLRYGDLSTKIAVETVHNMPFEIGALGGIGESYYTLMHSLDVRRHDAKRIGCVLSKEALRSSKAIFDFRDRRDWPH